LVGLLAGVPFALAKPDIRPHDGSFTKLADGDALGGTVDEDTSYCSWKSSAHEPAK